MGELDKRTMDIREKNIIPLEKALEVKRKTWVSTLRSVYHGQSETHSSEAEPTQGDPGNKMYPDLEVSPDVDENPQKGQTIPDPGQDVSTGVPVAFTTVRRWVSWFCLFFHASILSSQPPKNP